jgi:hypothetical protein
VKALYRIGLAAGGAALASFAAETYALKHREVLPRPVVVADSALFGVTAISAAQMSTRTVGRGLERFHHMPLQAPADPRIDRIFEWSVPMFGGMFMATTAALLLFGTHHYPKSPTGRGE